MSTTARNLFFSICKKTLTGAEAGANVQLMKTTNNEQHRDIMTYAILTDISELRATATSVTTDYELVAQGCDLSLGPDFLAVVQYRHDNHELAVVPDSTREDDRVIVTLCKVIEDVASFVAKHTG